ncbi:MAG: hypothetical protein IPP13_03275 [Kouleothrix sp.]|nr:hypothetical protein [Kouleothrix sp.]
MNNQQISRWRISLTGIILLAELGHLLWEYFTGGVRSHHMLNRADLPALSNWWGILLLPALTWFLTGRSHTRMLRASGEHTTNATLLLSSGVGFGGALLFGIGLSVAFTNNYENAAAFLFFGMFVVGTLLPVYRAECVLGFVVGMTFTFGAVLPFAIGSIIAAISAILHRLIYPVMVRCWKWLRWRSVPPP